MNIKFDKFDDLDDKYKKRLEIQKKNNSGIYKIEINQISFFMLCINNDDTNVLDSLSQNNFPGIPLIKWSRWSSDKPGIYIDIGAHSGIYSLLAAASNKKNKLISLEPLPINYYRILTNIRLNGYFFNRFIILNVAASNENKKVKFSIDSDISHLSKGGKISDEGINVNAIKLDELIFKSNQKVCGLKIDTEGEDLSVLIGAKNIIKNNFPKIIIEAREKNIREIRNFLKDVGYNYVYENDPNENEIELMNFKRSKTKDIFAEKDLD